MSDISRHAVVDPSAQLADDVCVGPFCYIGPKVTVAAGCVIHNNATIRGRTALGRDCRVFPLAAIGLAEDPVGPPVTCTIGAGNTIREHVTVYGGVRPGTRIGTSNLFMVACRVGAGAVIEDQGIFANCTQFGAKCHVESYVRTSGFALIDAARVGAYSFAAAFVNIRNDVPPFAVLQGMPLKVRGVNATNLERCGFGDDDIRALKTAFRELFEPETGQVDLEALARLRADEPDNPHVCRLLEALQADADRSTGVDHA